MRGTGTLGQYLNSITRFAVKKSKSGFFVPILLIVLVLTVFLLITHLDNVKKASEGDGLKPAVVSELTSAEPMTDEEEAADSGENTDKEAVALPDDGEIPPVDKPASVVEKKEPEPDLDEKTVNSLIKKDTEELERLEGELVDMKSMLALLEERGDDAPRIEQYKQLIADTEKKIADLQNEISRYNKMLEG
ncbi:MAG: hypothetical protein LBN34_05265 [Clostridiales Family XIII bacterium]|jgi:peptidoglycan hydrolase CwlO-like protein|nr:hypothetical protein [Clostridiales Family XIII bacterium]